ncbi:hypothetical protein NQ315_002796 [Exocentrus adspersus]|uniref:ribonuclease H n=1 Tax=Exocentrus adspersus TaxID=1586481 RepID=A0AAV8VJY8_9CUCU|nr:hypothetical protein NQ315_002796 [Exocentrus adspersus]
MPLYLQEFLGIEVLMMIGYGEQVRSQAEVAVLFSENHPELRPISQGTVSKIYTQYRDLGHVRDVKRQRQPRINEEVKSPARKVAREHGVSHTTVRKWLKDAKMHLYKIQLVHELNEDDPDRRVDLGVVLDEKLSWTPHIERQVQRATASFWRCRQLFGKTWGLNPRISLWMYTAVIRPAFLYAVIVWWPATRRLYIRQQLSRLQRMACISVTGAMRTAPTEALEALLSLPRLHIEAEAGAMRASYRVKQWRQWRGRVQDGGHVSALNQLVERDKLLEAPSDKIPLTYVFKKNYTVEIPSREVWNQDPDALVSHGLVWFTDGSKTLEGTGAGVRGVRPRVELSFPLGKHASVFQAEVFAISACVSENLKRGYSNQHIQICTDSQAALHALKSPRITSQVVLECTNSLAALGQRNKVRLVWVPGHSGVAGNEEADVLARKGSSDTLTGPEPAIGLPYSYPLGSIDNWTREKCQEDWSRGIGLRQARLLIKGPGAAATRSLVNLNH